MHDELIAHWIEVPGGELRLLQPLESAELPDVDGAEWAPILPYWSVLWRSGLALARELESLDLNGVRVLELGCGLGVPSLAAARAGAEVLATDSDPEALALLARNAAENETPIEIALVDWERPDELFDRPRFDLILAADVLYEDAAVALLLALLPQLAPRAWIADPGREPAAAFLDRAQGTWATETELRGVIRIHRMELGPAPIR